MTTLNNPNLMRFFIRIKTLCLVIFAYTYISATEIRLAYSDLFPADFQKYLYQIASEIEEDLNLDFTNFSAIESGSLPILEDFLSNRLDICIIALPENNDFPILPEDSVVKIPFCYKSSVVVVNAENPASEITINQLGMMFSTSSPSSNLLTDHLEQQIMPLALDLMGYEEKYQLQLCLEESSAAGFLQFQNSQMD